jgi:hypothetical protein
MKLSDIYQEIKDRATRWSHTQPSLTLAVARQGDDIHLEFHHPKKLSDTQQREIDVFISQRLREKFKFDYHKGNPDPSGRTLRHKLALQTQQRVA